jgi:5-formyltetrahydrofolate cyclo-ligase
LNGFNFLPIAHAKKSKGDVFVNERKCECHDGKISRMSAEAVTLEKQAMRASVLARRSSGHSCGHSHSQLLIDFSWEHRVKSVACFISFGDEPNTNVFLKHCQFNDRITLYVPRVNGEDLEWVVFDEQQARHPLGMSEPLGEAIALSEVDLMVLPALAADRFGNRLGRGRGFYDRALTEVKAKKTVVVVHDDELVNRVPTEDHDVVVQAICTCSEIFEV